LFRPLRGGFQVPGVFFRRSGMAAKCFKVRDRKTLCFPKGPGKGGLRSAGILRYPLQACPAIFASVACDTLFLFFLFWMPGGPVGPGPGAGVLVGDPVP